MPSCYIVTMLGHHRIKIIAALLIVVAGAYFSYSYLEFARLWFDVVGVDVSHYQGDIDWPRVAKSDVRFVYVKATEGGDYVDPKFKENWQGARAAGLATGAYHFFTRCKSGQEQAKNFLTNLPSDPNMLFPVLDVEKMEPCPDTSNNFVPAVEIKAFLDAVAQQRGCRPLIYITPEFDWYYLQGEFSTERFWVRSIMVPPIFRRASWVFWQYHNSGVRPGFVNAVDLDVFRGSFSEFTSFRLKNSCSGVPAN